MCLLDKNVDYTHLTREYHRYIALTLPPFLGNRVGDREANFNEVLLLKRKKGKKGKRKN